MTTSIYALFDPRKPDVIMYVGKGSEKRARYHWTIFLSKGHTTNVLLKSWFSRLAEEKVEPGWKFLETGVPEKDWKERECHWISVYKKENRFLCNISKGGNVPSSTFETCSAGGRRAQQLHHNMSRENGLKNGRKGMLRLRELHPEIVKEAGRRGGINAGKNGGGLRVAWERYPEKMREAARKNGALGGWKELGHRIGVTGIGLHTRWHTRKNKYNPKCVHCIREHRAFLDLI